MEEIIEKWREFNKQWFEKYAQYHQMVQVPQFADFMDWLARQK